MEKLMTDKLTFCLDELLEVVTKSKEYKTCLELKEKMKKNIELTDLIEKLKAKQKQYVKSSFQDEKVKEELKELEEKINKIPLYITYNQNLEVVNEMLTTITEELNEYFKEKFNILK